MKDLASILSLPGILIALLVLFLAVARVRKEHADHVRVLWFLFSLTLCIVVPYYIYYVVSGDFMHDVMTPAEKRSVIDEFRYKVFDILTDPVGDLYFALAVLYIAIVPQLLSFILSGLFGCASAPVLALEITKFAILGLIKSFCTLSAILLARMIVQLIFFKDFFGNNNLFETALFPTLFQSAAYVAAAFIASYVYLHLDRIKRLSPSLARLFNPLVGFFIRNNREKVESSPSESTLEKLLRPMIGHILGDIQLKEVAHFILQRRLSGPSVQTVEG